MAIRKTYVSNFNRYFQWTLEEAVSPYDQYVVRSYLLYRVRRGVKWQTRNSIYSAMRKLFREVLDRPWSFKNHQGWVNITGLVGQYHRNMQQNRPTNPSQ